MFLVFSLLWLAGFCLRLTILAVPPVALQLSDQFALSGPMSGALTTLPMLTIALGALACRWLVNAAGLQGALVIGLVATGALSFGRLLAGDAVMLLGATAAMGVSIGLFQTALPAVVRIWTPTKIAFGCAVYLNGMMIGEFASAGLSLPLLVPVVGPDWQSIIGFWSIVVAAVGVAALIKSRVTPEPAEAPGTINAPKALWDRQAIALGVPLGGSIAAFYAVNAYAGDIAFARGETEQLPLFLLVFNLMPMLASLWVLRWASWIGDLNWVRVSTWLTGSLLVAFMLVSGWTGLVVACAMAFWATMLMILLMGLPSVVLSGKAVSDLTASMSVIGYALGFGLPWVGGVLAESTGQIDTVVAPVAVALLLSLAGLRYGISPDRPTVKGQP